MWSALSSRGEHCLQCVIIVEQRQEALDAIADFLLVLLQSPESVCQIYERGMEEFRGWTVQSGLRVPLPHKDERDQWKWKRGRFCATLEAAANHETARPFSRENQRYAVARGP